MNDIYSYYQQYDESTRLTRDRLHRGEYHVTMYLLRKYLTKVPLRILDCCAGCGVYAVPLAEMGHTVVAGDLVPEHAAYMREHCSGLAEIYEGSVCDLSRFESGSFDAVLNLGAMYHLQDPVLRELAVKECLRVLKPGGIFIYAYQSLDAMVLGSYWEAVRCIDPQQRLELYRRTEETRRTHCRDIFYGMTFGETEEIAAHYGLKKISTANTYPVFYPFFREIDSLTEEEYSLWLEACALTCEEESVARNGMHGLWIGRKP